MNTNSSYRCTDCGKVGYGNSYEKRGTGEYNGKWQLQCPECNKKERIKRRMATKQELR